MRRGEGTLWVYVSAVNKDVLER